jgi:hypothetical protein
MSRFLPRVQMVLAVAVWYVALWGRLLLAEPFTSWLYHFAWWPLLLLLDGILWRRRGWSGIWHRPGEFLRLACYSVTAWLIFELFNLRLLNWRYINLEPRLWLRWPGYVLAFATVLPGILFTAEVLKAKGVGNIPRGQPCRFAPWPLVWLGLGVVFLVLPLMVPGYAFPLVWLAFFFLLDPLVDLLTGDSLTRRFWAGERQEPFCLLLAGLVCGFWWELWNFPARSKWIYTLPFFNFGRIFEMPVLGYLGFLPFALECAVMYEFFRILEQRLALNPRGQRCFYGVQFLFWIIMFAALDAVTVISFQGQVQ